MNTLKLNIKNIINSYLMIDKRTVRINKNNVIGHLTDIEEIITKNTELCKYIINNYPNTAFSFEHGIKIKKTNKRYKVINYYAKRIIDKYNL